MKFFDYVKYIGIWLAGVWVLGYSPLHAATITAPTCSQPHVQAAVDATQDGDTVLVPAGTATWTETLNITKNITLQGAGAGATFIINGIVGGSIRPALVDITLEKDLPFRMTGFTFKGSPANAQEKFGGEIAIYGNSHSLRVDHCTFDSLNGTNLSIEGFIWGVIDHCLFNTSTVQADPHPIIIGHRAWNGENFGHGSWADDPYWGSEKFLFIEDNVFETTGGGIDSFEGARFVVRHNQFHNCGLVMHSTGGQGRSPKQVEEYNNTYRNDTPDQAGMIRGGTLITHDNTWTNVARGHVLQADRLFYKSPHWGPVDGQNLWDKNVPNGAIGYWATGTHTGADGATKLEDTNPNKTWWDDAGVQRTGAWPPKRWYAPGATYIVRNTTQEDSPGRSRTFALDNDVNTITYSQLTGTGEDHVRFNTGDTYEIWKVSQALDQPGMGKSDLLVGLGDWETKENLTTPYADPHQVAEPCYSWNNKRAGTEEAINLFSTEPSIKAGRDFFNETRKDSYTPYVHPHPLVSGIPPPMPEAGVEPAFIRFKNVFNPTKETLTIRYTLAGGNAIALVIRDRSGVEIRKLQRGTQNGDTFETTWDGRNEAGAIVASGSYTVVLKQGDKTVTKQVVAVK